MKYKRTWRAALSLGCFLCLSSAAAGQDQTPTAKAEVPADYVPLKSALGGYFYVAAPLKQKYVDLLARAQALRDQVVRGEIDEAEARREVDELQSVIAETLKQIEEQKLQITAARVHTKEETTTFDLGPEQALCIVAGRVRIVGWNEPGVKCVLEKTILTLADESPDADFDGIRLAHEHGVADQVVGQGREQAIAEASKGGRPLSKLAQSIIDQKAAFLAPFQALQGKPIDVVRIGGLEGSEGNRQISIELTGPDGKTSSSQWRRHAQVTVYVPACRLVAVRGGRGGLEVESLAAGLAIVGEGDRDFAAISRVRDVTGDLVARNVWLHQVENIKGNVSVEQTGFDGNTGTRYFGETRTHYSGATEELSLAGIGGDLRVRVVKASLSISRAGGSLHVRNDFGDTTLAMEAPPEGARLRLYSEAGQIGIRLPKEPLPAVLLTECGTLKCIGARPWLQQRTISTISDSDSARRNWKAFVSESIEFMDLLSLLQSIPGDTSGPGLLAISRGGGVTVE